MDLKTIIGIFSNKDISKKHCEQHTPQIISISYDRLKLLLLNYINKYEKSNKWLGYLSASSALWLNIVVADFSNQKKFLFFNGEQWKIVFVIAAIFWSIKAAIGIISYLRKPNLTSLLQNIVSNADTATEIRAVFVLKNKSQNHDHKILVYRDVLWGCYLLPHYKISNHGVLDTNDPALLAFIGATLGISPDSLNINYHQGLDLNSWKHSEFHKTTTVYNFHFYNTNLNGTSEIPDHLRNLSFEWNGKSFHWMSISEMESDENTRLRNIDVTRHLMDNNSQFLFQTPDFFPTQLEVLDEG